jgi:hypothetical protein
LASWAAQRAFERRPGRERDDAIAETLEREVGTALPLKGVIKAVAMGSASTGPLLVHWAVGTQELDRATFTLIDPVRMRVRDNDVKVYPQLGMSSRDFVHLRAAANGRLFGMWCTSHSPSGVGVIVASELGSQSYYAHSSFGHVVPGPDGRALFTAQGTCEPQVTLTGTAEPQSDFVLPAVHGDSFDPRRAVVDHNPGFQRPLAAVPIRQLGRPRGHLRLDRQDGIERRWGGCSLDFGEPNLVEQRLVLAERAFFSLGVQ